MKSIQILTQHSQAFFLSKAIYCIDLSAKALIYFPYENPIYKYRSISNKFHFILYLFIYLFIFLFIWNFPTFFQNVKKNLMKIIHLLHVKNTPTDSIYFTYFCILIHL